MRCTFVALCSSFAVFTAGAALVSVDFEYTGASTFSGVDTTAAAADPVFQNANLWNSVKVPYSGGASGGVIDPLFPGLVDSTGAPTMTTISFTGEMYSYGLAGSGGTDLRDDFLYINTGVRDWTISGLEPGTPADLFLHNNAAGQTYRTFGMLVDTDGNGSLDGSYSVHWANGALVSDVMVSPTGTISGRMYITDGQPSWTGFQLSAVTIIPEAGQTLLAVFGLTGLLAARRRGR